MKQIFVDRRLIILILLLQYNFQFNTPIFGGSRLPWKQMCSLFKNTVENTPKELVLRFRRASTNTAAYKNLHDQVHVNICRLLDVKEL